MKKFVCIFLALGLSGCSRFYSNVDFDELGDYSASFEKTGGDLGVSIKNVPGLNISSIEQERRGDTLVIAAHRISSGGARQEKFLVPVPDGISKYAWLNRDGTTDMINPPLRLTSAE